MGEYSIKLFDHSMKNLLPRKQEPFEVIGRLTTKYDGENWTLGEELLEKPREKTYPDSDFDPEEYLDNPDEAAFLAFYGKKCVGSLCVCRRWNGNAFIDDLAIDREHRGHGVGTMLMDAAVKWGRDKGLNGMSLETQNWNLNACRFYLKYGFELGGIDKFCYTAKGYAGETALYFYLNNNKYTK